MMLYWRFPEQHRTPLIKSPSLRLLEFDVYSRINLSLATMNSNGYLSYSIIVRSEKKGKRSTRVNFQIFLSILLSIK